MSNKTYLIVAIVGLVLLLLGWYLLFSKSSPIASTNDTNSTTTVDPRRAVTPDQAKDLASAKGTITFLTPTKQLTINNIFKYPKVQTANNEVVYVLKSEADYTIFYYPDGNYFAITIQSQPYASIRSIAENEFLRATNLARQDACEVPVEVEIGDRELIGFNYGFSFCKSGLPMPK